MNSVRYIGLDVHRDTISAAVLNESGRLIQRSVLITRAAAILDFIGGVRGTLHVTFEEGTHSAWLYDLLSRRVEKLVVCNPRKNALLKSGNKGDAIDARKLAELLRAGLLSPVYHGETSALEVQQLARSYLFSPCGKTKAARRQIALTAAVHAILKRRLESAKHYVFPCDTDDTRPVPKVNNAHDRAVRDSKVAAFRLYDLRHTWATRAAMSGIDLVTLASMLGHSKINMVMRYAHPTQEHQTKAMEKMSQYVAQQQIAAAELSLQLTSQAVQ